MITDALIDAARAVVTDARKCYPAGLPRGVYVAVSTDALRALESALTGLASAAPAPVESPASSPPACTSEAVPVEEMFMATKKAAPKQALKVKAAKPKVAAKKPAKKAPDNGGTTDNGATA